MHVVVAAILGLVAGAAQPIPEPVKAINEIAPFTLADLGHAMVCLVVAAGLGAILAFRPRPAGGPQRGATVIQTQIMLAIVGSLVMLIVGASLARAFAIAGVAGLVRYRAKIDDPKDASVMLSCLAVGLASGVGLIYLAAAGTLFIMGVLRILEWREPWPTTQLRAQGLRQEPGRVEVGVGDAAEEAPHQVRATWIDRKGNDILGGSAAGQRDRPNSRKRSVHWARGRAHRSCVGGEESGPLRLIVEPDDGIGPVIAAINKAKTSIDIGIFRLDRRDIESALGAAATRGVIVRTLVAHTNRGGDKQLRKLEHDLLKTGVSVRRTDDDLPRYHNKMMIVDRSHPLRAGLQLHRPGCDKAAASPW